MRSGFIIPLLALICFSCSSTRYLGPTSADLSKASEKIPGITLTELQNGFKLYSVKCSACHRLHDPAEFTAVSWQPILTKMFPKAKLNDENQKILIHNYVMAESK